MISEKRHSTKSEYAPILMERIIPEPMAPSRKSPFCDPNAMLEAKHDMAVLHCLHHRRCCTSELAARTKLPHTTLARTIKRLEKDGLIGKENKYHGRWFIKSI